MRSLAVLLVVPLALVLGCEVAEAECTRSSDCGAAERVCDGCPEMGDSLCESGACVLRGDDAVDVSGTVALDRDIDDQVQSFVHSLVSTVGPDGSLVCETAFDGRDLDADANALAVGFKNVSGGALHQDVNLGRAPDVPMLVVVTAFSQSAGQGDALGAGCVGPLESDGSEILVDLLNVVP